MPSLSTLPAVSGGNSTTVSVATTAAENAFTGPCADCAPSWSFLGGVWRLESCDRCARTDLQEWCGALLTIRLDLQKVFPDVSLNSRPRRSAGAAREQSGTAGYQCAFIPHDLGDVFQY